MRHYALFVGYPRSGHTLVAALLDAHPNMLFANGLDATQYVQCGFEAQEIAALSIWNCRRFTRHGRRSNGYQYAVGGGLHGVWESLEIVGDKSGDLLSYRLLREPGLLDNVLARFSDLARFIHVIRNPFDCIATMATRSGVELRVAAEDFLTLCEANQRARAAIPESAWKDVRLEQLIERPAGVLREICAFLGTTPDGTYLDRCAKLVFQAPHKSRHDADWPESLVADLTGRLRAFAWFDGYRFR